MSSPCFLALLNNFLIYENLFNLFLVIIHPILLPKSFFSKVSINPLNTWIDLLCSQSFDQELMNDSWIDPPRSVSLIPFFLHA